MDNELMSVLEQFKQAIDMCMDKIEYMDKMFEDFKKENDERVHSLESTLYDEIINPTKEYIAEEERNARFADFDSKYGEKLRPYNKELSVLEGDDFDIVRSAFDKYDEYEGDKVDMDTYVEKLIEEVGNQLEAIKRGLGLPEDAEIEVKQTEDGETVVEVEDEGEATEEEVVASTEDDLPEDEEAEEDDPEEVAAFEEELKRQS
ncbi:MAG: hypothetical protein MJZ50_01715 [Treponema sp.]|nr:hypothetical protein [Treponema sp.]